MKGQAHRLGEWLRHPKLPQWLALTAAVLLAVMLVDGLRPFPAATKPRVLRGHDLTVLLVDQVAARTEARADPPSARPRVDGTGPTAAAKGEGGAGAASVLIDEPASLELFWDRDGRYVKLGSHQVDHGRWQGKLPPGNYWALARAPGKARAALRFVMPDRPARRPLRLLMEPAHQLKIEVVRERDAKTVALKGATVLVGRPGELPFGGLTSSDGAVQLEALPEGPWQVRVFAPGFEPYEAEVSSNLLVRLRPVRTLQVSVTHHGKPVPAATVHISGVSLWPARSVRTGPKGYVNVTGLKAGSYALYASQGSLASPVVPQVELLPGEGTTKVELQLEEGEFLLARIHDASGEPIAGAKGSFSSHGAGQFMAHELSDEHGMLRLGPFVDQEGVVQVRAPGYVSRVVPAAFPGPQEIELIRAGKVAGRVVDGEGFPVVGATVEVIGSDVFGMPVSVTHQTQAVADAHFDWSLTNQNVLVPAGELGVLLGPVPPIPLAEGAVAGASQLYTNDKGRFEIEGVPPGKLVVLARHPDFLDGKSEPFELAPGGRAEVEVVLGRGRALRGRVLDHREFPVPDARVRLTAPGFERVVAVDSDGTFRVGAAPKDVTLRVARASRPLLVLYEHRVEALERDEEIELLLPEPRQPSRIRLVGPDGDPVSLAQVGLSSKEPAIPLRATRFSSETGWVDFDESRGLRVELAIDAPGFVNKRVTRRLRDEQEVALVPALKVEGRITGVRGRLPAAGAVVTLKSDQALETTSADALGEYRLEGVPPGPATLSARHSEYGKGELKTVVRPGVGDRPSQLPDLDLAPAARISGRVVDGRGFPLSGVYLSGEPISAFFGSRGQPRSAAVSDESGEFELELLRDEGPLVVYAAWPAHGVGYTGALELDGRGEAGDIELALSELDEATTGELGTALVSLVDKRGLLQVFAVARPSSAFDKGVRPGDILKLVDGYQFEDIEEARQLLSGVPGTEVELTLERQGRPKVVRLSREAFQRPTR